MSLDPPLLSPVQVAAIRGLVHATPAMREYSTLGYAMSIGFDFIALVWLWALLHFGVSRRIEAVATRKSSPLFLAAAGYWTLYRVLRWLVFLPVAIYAGFVFPHHYGLSNLSLAGWFGESVKALAVDTVIGAVLAGLLLVAIKREPKQWPYWAVAASAPLIAFGIFAAPLVIDPLFNKFTPLPATDPLRPGIERLALRAGIGNADIFIVDKSKQTNATNAYVTGIGSSNRIVIWDTLAKKMTSDEVDAVIAHEIGHYVEGHVVIGYVASLLGLLVALPLIRVATLALLRRYGERWGVRELHQPAAIPALLLVVNLLAIAVSPVVNVGARYVEHRADAFGLALNGDRAAAARSFIALSRDNLSDPDPPLWIDLMLDHPPLGERIEYAISGKPSELWPLPPLVRR